MKKINPKLFKLAMSKFATGVTVITINEKGLFIGKTINSFSSVSLTPPLVLFSLDKKSSSLRNYKEAKSLGINILAKNQRKVSNYFSNKKPIWGSTKYFLTKKNIPMIEECVANIGCRTIKKLKHGDHIIFICQVIEIQINDIKKPLIYLNSKYI